MGPNTDGQTPVAVGQTPDLCVAAAVAEAVYIGENTTQLTAKTGWVLAQELKVVFVQKESLRANCVGL